MKPHTNQSSEKMKGRLHMRKIEKDRAFTLIEMVVVVMIIGILSSIMIPVLTNQISKARIARTRADIRTLSVAIERYNVDIGEYPPSGSYNYLTETPSDPGFPSNSVGTGCGLLSLALIHSLDYKTQDAISSFWDGPYITPNNEQMDFNGFPSSTRGAPLDRSQSSEINGRDENSYDFDDQILDVFGEPFRYIRASDYTFLNGTKLPTASPFYLYETYYNARTFQIVSCGKNRISKAAPEIGFDADDISNINF